MDAAVFAAHPHAGHQVLGHAHVPAVGVVAGGAGFTANLVVIFPEFIVPQGLGGAAGLLHAAAQHVGHQPGGFGRDGALLGGVELLDDVAVPVFDARDEARLGAKAGVHERAVGVHHFVHAHVAARAQADAGHREQRRGDTDFVGIFSHVVPAHFLGQLGRHGVHGAGHGVAQRHVDAGVFAGHVIGLPLHGLAVFGVVDGHALVADAVAGRVAVVEGREIHEGLERGAGLALALAHVVVLEKAVVEAAHPGLNLAGEGVHAHHARLQEVLVIGQRIERRHEQRGVVVVVLPGEDLHRPFGVQGRVEALGLAFVVVGEGFVALGALHLGENEVGNFVAFVVDPGVRFAVAPEVVELALQRFHALVQGRFGVGLHARVDAKVDFEAVAVHVVARAVAPGIHKLAHRAAEVSIGPVDVALDVVVEFHGRGFEGGNLVFGQHAGLAHAVEHHVAAAPGGGRVKLGVVGRGVVEHAHEHGGFLRLEAVGRGVEEGFGRHFNAEGAGAVLHRVQVHAQNFLLGVALLQVDGREPLLGFGHDGAHHRNVAQAAPTLLAADFVEVFGQLLGDGGAAALLAAQRRVEAAYQRGRVDTRVLVVAHVFSGNEGLDEQRRHLAEGHRRAVFAEVLADEHAVGGVHLGGLLHFRVFEVGQAGRLTEQEQEVGAHQKRVHQKQNDDQPKQHPGPAGQPHGPARAGLGFLRTRGRSRKRRFEVGHTRQQVGCGAEAPPRRTANIPVAPP